MKKTVNSKKDELFNEAVITGELNSTEKDLDAFRKFVGARPKLTNLQKIKYKLKGFEIEFERYLQQEKLIEVVPVGSFLKECLSITGIKNKDIAKLLDISPSNLSAMLNGKRRLTVEQAYTFGQLFNTKGKFFIDIQHKNEWSRFISVKSKSKSNVRLENYLQAS